MLEHLFGSKTRVKLLGLFLNHPERPYFVRELARAAGTQINSIRRELENLETFGIVRVVGEKEESNATSEQKGSGKKKIAKRKKTSRQKKYYEANPSFILFSDLKSLLLKSHILLEEDFLENLKKIGNVHLLLLAGAFVGNEGKGPTDIFMVGDVDKEKVEHLIKKFEKTVGRQFNYTVMAKKEFEYRSRIVDRFLFDVFDSKHILLVDKRFLS